MFNYFVFYTGNKFGIVLWDTKGKHLQTNSRFFMLFEVEQRKRKSNNKTRKDGFNRESAMKYPTTQKPI